MSKLGALKMFVIEHYFCIKNIISQHFCTKPTVICAENTLKFILENNVSVSRYGDGELRWIYGMKQNTFQNDSEEMSKRLCEVLKSKGNNHIVCIPDCFGDLGRYNRRSRYFYNYFIGQNRKKWMDVLDLSKTYYDALISRFYIDYSNREYSAKIISMWKDIFRNRDILIVEGEYSRLGVGNDFFDNAKTLSRIIGPSENAFDYYKEIFNAVVEFANGKLVLLALGPTATIMAYDLAQRGIQAIDVGHIDIEYEWYTNHAESKEPVKYKYVNEAASNSGKTVIEIEDEKIKEKYDSEIVFRVGI